MNGIHCFNHNHSLLSNNVMEEAFWSVFNDPLLNLNPILVTLQRVKLITQQQQHRHTSNVSYFMPG